MLLPLLRRLPDRQVRLFRRRRIMHETAQCRQVEYVCVHQCLRDAADIRDQPVEQVETHRLTDDDAEDFGFFFVRCEGIVCAMCISI